MAVIVLFFNTTTKSHQIQRFSHRYAPNWLKHAKTCIWPFKKRNDHTQHHILLYNNIPFLKQCFESYFYHYYMLTVTELAVVVMLTQVDT